MYHVAYIEAIDLAISTIQDRFDQPGYAMYRNLEKLLLKATCGRTTVMNRNVCVPSIPTWMPAV